jgi:hypothetical protein
MLHLTRQFLNRPVAEDFGFYNQLRQSLLSGVYVFAFMFLFGGGHYEGWVRAGLLALFAAGCAIAALLANWFTPKLLPGLYDEDRWTVRKQIMQVLFVLLCVSVGNQLIMWGLAMPRPPFWLMYLSVTIIGFFPISVGVFINEQRRLKRNLAHAQSLNEQFAHPSLSHGAEVFTKQKLVGVPLQLVSDTGRERLTLMADQLRYIESEGNYVDVYWLHDGTLQKSVLRNTLKEVEASLAAHPALFRCHRAFVVNLNAVSHTSGNARGYQLTLSDVPSQIPVSRTYLSAFNSQFEHVNQLSC